MRLNNVDNFAFLCRRGMSTLMMSYPQCDFTHVSKDARLTLRQIPDIRPTYWQIVEEAHPDAKPGDQFCLFEKKLPLKNGGTQIMTYITERVTYRTFYGEWIHHVYVEALPPPPPFVPKYHLPTCM